MLRVEKNCPQRHLQWCQPASARQTNPGHKVRKRSGWIPGGQPLPSTADLLLPGPFGAGVEECESCSSGSRLQREVAERGPVRALPMVQRVLASSGRALDAPIRVRSDVIAMQKAVFVQTLGATAEIAAKEADS